MAAPYVLSNLENYFIAHRGLTLTPQDFKLAPEGAVALMRQEATPEDRQRIDEIYHATMTRARQLAARS